MKLIRSLMGRRQFLFAAGVTSTSAPKFSLDPLPAGVSKKLIDDAVTKAKFY